MGSKDRRTFPPISKFSAAGRGGGGGGGGVAAADLDGTLLVSRSSFPYFFLVAVEAGSYLRGLGLLLLAPVILALYVAVSEAAAIELLIFASMAGLRARDVEAAARAVLPRFYAADVRAEAWEAFRACGGRRRLVVTANPRLMVEGFVGEWLGAEVVGTEIQVDRRTGCCTGRVLPPGVLVGDRKREALQKVLGPGVRPDLGLGDRPSDHDFMAICKEAYMVPPNPEAARVAPEKLNSPVIFHDGRLVRRPDPLTALLTLLYLPVGFVLSLLRVFLNLPVPARLVRHSYRLTGIRLSVRGRPPPPPPSPSSPGSLFVCNHRTALDPIIVTVALGRPVSCVTYSVSRLSAALSPIPAVPLSRDRATDAARIKALLQRGDLVVCPEGTTCREPFLLRFSALFAELADRIVPVAIDTAQDVFYGSTVRGWKCMDPYFFFMNPRPGYTVTFLDPLRPEDTCGAGGRSPLDVANHVQRLIAAELGFKCTMLTRKDKYMKLGGNDGKVHSNKNENKSSSSSSSSSFEIEQKEH